MPIDPWVEENIHAYRGQLIIDKELLPKEEHSHAGAIGFLFTLLRYFEDEFAAGFELFNSIHTELNGGDIETKRYKHAIDMHWYSRKDSQRTLVAKALVISVWNFGDALQETKNHFDQSPSLKKIVDKYAMKKIVGRFGAHFSGLEGMRNSISHPSERLSKPIHRKSDAVEGVLIHASLSGPDSRDLHFTKDKRILKFGIYRSSLDELTAIRCAVYDAFRIIHSLNRSLSEKSQTQT